VSILIAAIAPIPPPSPRPGAIRRPCATAWSPPMAGCMLPALMARCAASTIA